MLLFDVDEHTGAFGGAKAYFEHTSPDRVDGVMIGYPGLDHVVTGGRGVLRARLHVHGVAGHSGASKAIPSAIAKAAALLTGADAAGVRADAKVAGPSNIGNYLAGLGIAATAGFGIQYRGLHGTDEQWPTWSAVIHRRRSRCGGRVWCPGSPGRSSAMPST